MAFIAYWPSFNAPFFLDDFRIILENRMLQDYLDLGAIWNFSPARFIVSWTFAVNYGMHGNSVLGYHALNFAIHILSGAGLFWLVRGLLRAQFRGNELPTWYRWLPWLVLGIFLLHPLQTQAVTYIVQRYSSMMAMFYLATLALFVWARVKNSGIMMAASCCAMLLAFFCKQSAATLPLAIVLIELLFFQRLQTRSWIVVNVAALLAFLCLFTLLHWPPVDVVGVTRETGSISRIDYFATQMQVLWRYIGLFFGFGEQRLEYVVETADGFREAHTWLLALSHLLAVGIGAALWRRAPLIAFGILFYYLAHGIESSIFPISDVAFEHRTYLPNAGLCIVVSSALVRLFVSLRLLRTAVIIVVGISLGLTVATFARNELWSDRIQFLQRETQLSPGSQRAWTSLGKELMRAGRFQDALDALREAKRIAVQKDEGELRPPTILNMIFALHYTGRDREAIALANATALRNLSSTERAYLFEARGRARLELRQLRAARADLTRSSRLNPTPNAVAYLAEAERRLGNRARAIQLAREVLRTTPGHPLAQQIVREADGG
jgi:tetratricopeptide (TPR) repeat protein